MLTNSGLPGAGRVACLGPSNRSNECVQLDARLASSRSEFTSIFDSHPAFVAIDVLVRGRQDVRAKLLGLRKWIGGGLRGRGRQEKSDCGDDGSSDRPPAETR